MEGYSYKPWARRRARKPQGGRSLMVDCLRAGELDVDLETGIPTGPGGRKIKTRTDADGYLLFDLARDVSRGAGGSYCEERRPGGKKIKRLRRRQKIFVHRLVMAKMIAVERYGKAWRAYVEDLPPAIDVNHIAGIRHDNRASQLSLETDLANRMRRPMDSTEAAAMCAAVDAAYSGDW